MSTRERSGSWFQKAVGKLSSKPKQKVTLPEASIAEEEKADDGEFEMDGQTEDTALHENHKLRKVSKSSTKYKARRNRDNQKVFVQFSFDGINILERKTRVVMERFSYSKVRCFKVNTFEGLFEFEYLNSAGDVTIMSFSCSYPAEMQRSALDYAHTIAHKQRSNTISDSRQSRSFTVTAPLDDLNAVNSGSDSMPTSPTRSQRSLTEYSPPAQRDASPPQRRGSIFDKPPVKPIEEPTKFLVSDLGKEFEELDFEHKETTELNEINIPSLEEKPQDLDEERVVLFNEEYKESEDGRAFVEERNQTSTATESGDGDSDNEQRRHHTPKKQSKHHSKLSHSSSSSSISSEAHSPSQISESVKQKDISSKKGDFLDL